MRHAGAMLAVALAACSPSAGGAPALGALAATGLPLMAVPEEATVDPPSRANAAIAQDILDLAFTMESGRPIPALARFEGPIRVRLAGAMPETAGADLDSLLARLRDEAGLDVARVEGGEAEIVVEAVPQADLSLAVPGAACFVVPSATSWRDFLALRDGGALDWTGLDERRRAAVFVPAGASPQEVRDCLHEELAQAIGPLNDLYRLPDSVFNDDNVHAVLTGFDMLVLRALYAPELASGMTRAEVARRLPALLARLNPAGERGAGETEGDTPAAWVAAIETALSGALGERREAAEAAVAITRAQGWTGPRAGFALYALGRAQAASDPGAALATFEAAAAVLSGSPLTGLHLAHVKVQLAAFALAQGDMARVLALTGEAAPVARAHGNAALLATLLMLRAEATGDPSEAQALRLDSLAWARYGFGPPEAVRARLAEVQALNPLRAVPIEVSG